MSHAVSEESAIATERNCVSLPGWFPADKAAAVLRHQKKQFALLADQQGVTRVASLEQLAHAPATKSVLWCGRPLGPAVAPTTSADEASRLLDDHPETFIPIVLGGVVLGILTRAAISSAPRLPVRAPLAPQPALSLAA